MSLSQPPRSIVVFGRPGSGKSSLSERLGTDFGYTLVRTGELLREAVRRGDDLGRRVDVHLQGGNLVPDSLILELLDDVLTHAVEGKLLFDGYPRTMGQVPQLELLQRKHGFAIECYLDVFVSRDAAVARMSGRRVCPLCGATYHLVNKPPRVPETCDLDGHRLEQRPDDTPAIIDQRQKVYEEHSGPILDYYRQHHSGQFVSVNAEQSLDAVYRETCQALAFAHVPNTP